VFAHLADGMLPTEASRNKILYGAFPPAFGLAILKILDKPEAAELSKAQLKTMYDGMTAHYEWWKSTRSFDGSSFSYNMSRECGFDDATYALCDFPLETPDLYAWFVLYSEALAALARIAGIDGADVLWDARAKEIQDTLVSKLWDGDRFICKGALSGRIFESGSVLKYLPIILGKRLPQEIIDKLAADLGDTAKYLSAYGFLSESRESEYFSANASGRGAVDMLLQPILILGLRAAGASMLAAKASAAVISGIEKLGVRDVVVADGDQPVRVPADNGDPVAASAVLAILGNGGKE
jgi:hypothetical protein